jgi:hypothetical protein
MAITAVIKKPAISPVCFPLDPPRRLVQGCQVVLDVLSLIKLHYEDKCRKPEVFWGPKKIAKLLITLITYNL